MRSENRVRVKAKWTKPCECSPNADQYLAKLIYRLRTFLFARESLQENGFESTVREHFAAL